MKALAVVGIVLGITGIIVYVLFAKDVFNLKDKETNGNGEADPSDAAIPAGGTGKELTIPTSDDDADTSAGPIDSGPEVPPEVEGEKLTAPTFSS